MPKVPTPEEGKLVTLMPVGLLILLIKVDNRIVEAIHDPSAQKSSLSGEIVKK